MKILGLTINELHQKFLNNELKVSEYIKAVYAELKKDFAANFLVTLYDEPDFEKFDDYFDPNNKLSAIPYLIKDNFWTKDIRTTAGSKILKNFYPTADATVVEKLNEHHAIPLGKATLDELGMGGTGLYGFNGEVRNPFDNTRIAGGSSSGSAYAVAKGYVPFATGTDTGDSIRKPASFVGVVGFKPTYGSLSRYGVIPYAPSLDHVGFFTNDVSGMATVCDATFGYDAKDFTSIDNVTAFEKNLGQFEAKQKFGYIKAVQKYVPEDIAAAYEKLYEQIRADGHEVVEVDFDKKLLDALPAVYMMISFSEAVSTHSNLDGINFGERVEGVDYIDTMKKSRAHGFEVNTKKRFVIGSFQLRKENQELLLAKSKKVRTLIIEALEKVYEQIDVLILPPALEPAPKVADVLGVEVEDRVDDEKVFLQDLLILANFNGMPSITIPFIKKDGLPIGINLNTKPKTDLLTLQAAKYLEDLIKKGVDSNE